MQRKRRLREKIDPLKKKKKIKTRDSEQQQQQKGKAEARHTNIRDRIKERQSAETKEQKRIRRDGRRGSQVK